MPCLGDQADRFDPPRARRLQHRHRLAKRHAGPRGAPISLFGREGDSVPMPLEENGKRSAAISLDSAVEPRAASAAFRP